MTGKADLWTPIRLCHEAGLHDDALQGTVILRDPAGAAMAVGAVEDGEYRIRFPGLATFAFRPGDGEMRVAAPSTTSRRVVDDLFRTAALPFMLQAEGYEAIHASAVQIASGGGVVAFAGFSGAGKTTVAFGLGRRGHGIWADDAVVFSRPDAPSSVLASPRLPHAVNLRLESRRFFDVEPGADLPVEAAGPEEDRLAAVVVLAPNTNSTSGVTRLSLAAGLTAILPHAYCFFADRGREQRTLTAYLDLVARIPVIQFQFPRGFVEFDAALDVLEGCLLQAVADV
jgi:hypothetical protein